MDPPTTFAEAADRRAELRCPDCGDPIICLWGCGWDYDRLVCSHYNCDWEHEYDTTVAPDRTKYKGCPMRAAQTGRDGAAEATATPPRLAADNGRGKAPPENL